MCVRGSTRFQVRCDVPPVHQELDRGVILPLQFTWPLLSRLPRQPDSKPDFQLSRGSLEIRRDRPSFAMPCCQARRQQRAKRLFDLAFKVRPVEGWTARHEALDADAMLHHRCMPTDHLPAKITSDSVVYSKMLCAVLANYHCRCGHGAAQKCAAGRVLRCWQSSSRLLSSPPRAFWKNRMEGLVTTSHCPFRRTRQLRRCSSFI